MAPFGEDAAVAYGPIYHASRERNGNALDKLIAAHAIALGVPIVTNNVKDFESYPGVTIDDWLNDDA